MKKVFSFRCEEKVIKKLKRNYGKSLTDILDMYLQEIANHKECPVCKQEIKKVSNG